MLQTALIILAVVISVLLIIVVLIQKSKGGGLASNFAGSNQIMGVRRTNNIVEKATWTFAIIVCLLSLASGMILARESKQAQPLVKEVPAAQQPAMTYDTNADEAATTVATDEATVTEETPAQTEETAATTDTKE